VASLPADASPLVGQATGKPRSRAAAFFATPKATATPVAEMPYPAACAAVHGAAVAEEEARRAKEPPTFRARAGIGEIPPHVRLTVNNPHRVCVETCERFSRNGGGCTGLRPEAPDGVPGCRPLGPNLWEVTAQ
jgi:hypothetical protein